MMFGCESNVSSESNLEMHFQWWTTGFNHATDY